MGKPVRSDVKRVETTSVNTRLNKKVVKEFRDTCAYFGYPMNVVIETFMQQYANGRFRIKESDILKWKVDRAEDDVFNTTFNKAIYARYKRICKENGYFVKHVLTAFMEKFAARKLLLEYVNVDENLAEEIEKFEEDFAEEIEKFEEAFTEGIEELEGDFVEKIEELEGDFVEEIEELEEDFTEEIEKLEEDLTENEERNQMREPVSEEIIDLKNLDKEIDRIKSLMHSFISREF